MSHNLKEANKEMEKAIFISADCWLEVFDLLPPSQLGLGIAMISRRFDYFVDEHFKTRKWKLGEMKIRRKLGHFWRFVTAKVSKTEMDSADEMEMINSNGKALPMPQNPLPNKIVGFKRISIHYFDHNVLTFLHRFHRFFATCTTKLTIATEDIQTLEFVLLNIWPTFKDTILEMDLDSIGFYQIRQLAPSILCNCPSLRVVSFHFDILPEFPPDESANASEGQAVAKWLFTPRPDNLPKQLIVSTEDLAVDQWLSTLEQIKAAFSSASSPVAFVILIEFPQFLSFSAVVPFKVSNKLTGEKLALALSKNGNAFLLVRCPIAAGDERKWLKEEMYDGLTKTAQQNKIEIFIPDGGVDDGLLDGSPGPSGDQKQQKK